MSEELQIVLRNEMTHDEWMDAGRRLLDIGHNLQWWIGDWLNFGERRYGENYTAGLELFGKNYNTLKSYKIVAGRFEKVRRRTNLSWAHHREAAAQSDPDEWLDRAEDEGWKRNDLRHEIREAMKQKTIAKPMSSRCLITAKRRMIDGLSHIRGLCRGLAELNPGAIASSMDHSEAAEWACIASEAAKQLKIFASVMMNTRKVEIDDAREIKNDENGGPVVEGPPVCPAGAATREVEIPDREYES